MKYVITGATSFIGLELIDFLQKQGISIIAICRPNSKTISELPSSVQVIHSEMSYYERLYLQISKADVFINLAWAGTGHDGRDIVDIQNDNVKYSLDAMRAAKEMGCKVFVEAGSQAEYGSTLEPQREDMQCHPFSEYGKAKLRMKEKGFALAKELGIKYVHLRIFSLFGENDHPWTLVMSAINKMLKEETVDLSPCTQNWNFLYVRDAVEKITALTEYAITKTDYLHEVYNIASCDTRTLREFVMQIHKLVGSNSKLKFGAIQPKNMVSLQPETKKLEAAIGQMKEENFEHVIEKIKKHFSVILDCRS